MRHVNGNQTQVHKVDHNIPSSLTEPESGASYVSGDRSLLTPREGGAFSRSVPADASASTLGRLKETGAIAMLRDNTARREPQRHAKQAPSGPRLLSSRWKQNKCRDKAKGVFCLAIRRGYSCGCGAAPERYGMVCGAVRQHQ